MPHPFIDTPAQLDASRLTTAGGNCFNFELDLPNDARLTSSQIQARLSPFSCFNEPPIINDPTLDIPWNSPPPVETGCYPLRARAQTTMDPDLPEGLTAEFVDSPKPDKCFPILDLKLNLNTIIDQVLSIIVPGAGGGGPGVIPDIPSIYGCCCDEYGSYYLGQNDDGYASCYSGLIGDCMGQYMPQNCSNGPWGGGQVEGGVGVSWDNQERNGISGAACSKCASEGWPSCCCSTAISKFEKPRVIGVGEVIAKTGGGNCIGDPYTVLVHAGTTFSGPGSDPSPNQDLVVDMVNLREAKNTGADPGLCTDGRYIPGIAGTEILASYPANFEPQRICPGTVVTVFGITDGALEQSGFKDLLEGSVPTADLGGCFGSGQPQIVMWFEVENAHDAGCSEDDCGGGEGAAPTGGQSTDRSAVTGPDYTARQLRSMGRNGLKIRKQQQQKDKGN